MYLEDFGQMLWFHTDVHKWTPTIKTKYLEDLNLLQYLVSIPIVATVKETDTKLAKFGKTVGFKYEKTFTSDDGNNYLIYSRSL